MKFLIAVTFLLAILAFSPGCGTTMLTVKINAVDSAIRIAYPDHNCGCDYGDKTISYPQSRDGKANVYFWQSVYMKSEITDYTGQSKKIKAELIKLMPELEKYPRLYLEFRRLGVNPADTSKKYTVIGSAFFLRDKCDGFVKDVDAKQLIKRSHDKKFETGLCEKK